MLVQIALDSLLIRQPHPMPRSSNSHRITTDPARWREASAQHFEKRANLGKALPAFQPDQVECLQMNSSPPGAVLFV